MPLFEYRCRKCGAQMELLVNSSEAKPECPECGSGQMEKLASTFAAVGSSNRTKVPGVCGEGGGPCCSGGGCPYQ